MEMDNPSFSQDLFDPPIGRAKHIRRKKFLEDFVEGEKLHFSVCSISRHLLGLNKKFLHCDTCRCDFTRTITTGCFW